MGQRLRGAALATSILEGGGRTPWMDPKDLHALGYTMLLYPTTLIFQVTRAIQKAAEGLKAHRPRPADDSVTFGQYEDMLGLPLWAQIEDEFAGKHADPSERLGVPRNAHQETYEMAIRLLRLYTGDDGQSHFAVGEIALHQHDAANAMSSAGPGRRDHVRRNRGRGELRLAFRPAPLG